MPQKRFEREPRWGASNSKDTVWFYDMEADGYSLDDKRNEIKDNDIPDLLNRYHNLANESERARTDKCKSSTEVGL